MRSRRPGAAGDLALPLTYQFEPGSEADGVTVHVPLAVLGQLDPEPFGWQVPGLREELVTALIRSLPKAMRRSYVPAPNFATAALAALADRIGAGDLRDGARRGAGSHGRQPDRAGGLGPGPGARSPADDLRGHASAGADSPSLGRGTDLAALARRLAPRTTQALGAVAAQVGPDLDGAGLRTWAPGEPPDLPELVEVARAGSVVRGYPALVDEGDTVSRPGARLGRRRPGQPRPRVAPVAGAGPALAGTGRAARAEQPAAARPWRATARGGTAGLLADCLDALLDDLVGPVAAEVRGSAAYAALLDRVRPLVAEASANCSTRPRQVLIAGPAGARPGPRVLTSMALLPALTDVQAQLATLLPDRFVTRAGVRRMPDLERYLRAHRRSGSTGYRTDRGPDDVAMWQVHGLEDEARRAMDRLPESATATRLTRDEVRLDAPGAAGQPVRLDHPDGVTGVGQADSPRYSPPLASPTG